MNKQIDYIREYQRCKKKYFKLKFQIGGNSNTSRENIIQVLKHEFQNLFNKKKQGERVHDPKRCHKLIISNPDFPSYEEDETEDAGTFFVFILNQIDEIISPNYHCPNLNLEGNKNNLLPNSNIPLQGELNRDIEKEDYLINFIKENFNFVDISWLDKLFSIVFFDYIETLNE